MLYSSVKGIALLILAMGCLHAQSDSEECLQHRRTAEALFVQKNFRAASLQFELAARCSSDRGVLQGLAQSRLMEGRFADTIRALNELLAVYPKDSAALRLRAKAEYLSGRDEEAQNTLLRALALDPADHEAEYALGRVYYQLTRYVEAAEQFKRVISQDTLAYKAYDNLGLCYEALADYPQAIAAYLKALDLVHNVHREYEWPYANLAELLIKLGQPEKAFDLAVEAATRNPQSARNCYLAGKALFKLGKPDLSIRWLKRSVALDPAYSKPRYILAQIYRGKGMKPQAAAEFQAFRDIAAKEPRNPR